MGKKTSSKAAAATALLTALLLGPASVQGFLSPAIWSRINSHLRLHGQQQHQHQQQQRAFLPLVVGGRRSFAQRVSALQATAPMSFGDFGGSSDDALNFAEMREQLGALESQLAGAMELGTSCDRVRGADGKS